MKSYQLSQGHLPWPRFSFSLRNAAPDLLPCRSPYMRTARCLQCLQRTRELQSHVGALHKFLPTATAFGRVPAATENSSDTRQLCTFSPLIWRIETHLPIFSPDENASASHRGKSSCGLDKVVRKLSEVALCSRVSPDLNSCHCVFL